MNQKLNWEMNIKNFSQSGNALLSVIFFAAISIMISTAAIIVMSLTLLTGNKVQQGTTALSVAESGAENAVLRLLRNPGYTGEVVSVGNGEAQITVSGSGPYTIRSQGSFGNSTRIIQVQVGYTNNILSIQSWRELSP